MRTFKRLNVVKETCDENKAAKLLADGFAETTPAENTAEKPAKKRNSKKAAGEAASLSEHGGEALDRETSEESPAEEGEEDDESNGATEIEDPAGA